MQLLRMMREKEQAANAIPDCLLYGIKETALKLSISERKLNNMVSNKEIKSCKVGGRRMFKAIDLLEYVNGLEVNYGENS